MSVVCCVVSDLIFATKIRGTAAAVGVDVAVVSDRAAMLAHLDDAATLILDLNLESDEAVELIRLARARPTAPRIVAYCAHVDKDLAAAAEEAGADSVVPRSKFVAALPEILSGAPKTQSRSRNTGSG
jgi:CheY-like chemotaxis protein